jgi:hypothetical protein
MALPLALGIGAVLSTIIVPLVVKVFIALGFGFVTYSGIQLLLDVVLAQIQAQFAAMPVEFDAAVALFGYMNVDKAITMIFSAIVMRATLRGLQAGGDFKKIGFS